MSRTILNKIFEKMYDYENLLDVLQTGFATQ